MKYFHTVSFLVSGIFSRANVTIKEAEQIGMDTRIMNVQYASAENAWKRYDYDTTKMWLQKILPVPALLPILGMLLLQVLLRRR